MHNTDKNNFLLNWFYESAVFLDKNNYSNYSNNILLGLKNLI